MNMGKDFLTGYLINKYNIIEYTKTHNINNNTKITDFAII